MKRRLFIKHSTSAAVGLPVMLNGLKVSALANANILSQHMVQNNKVLVLIQLNGGNDGLNTIIPLDKYDILGNVRSNILIPENQLISVTDDIGFHPSMTGIKNLYDEGRFLAVRNVGYPEANRSHFRSTDIWTSASPATEYYNTGWLGRQFEIENGDFPTGYPNDSHPDPFALSMISSVSETCQGTSANFSIALTDPFNVNSFPESALGSTGNTRYGRELKFLQDLISQSNAYGENISSAAQLGNNTVTYNTGNNALASQLKNIALLLSGGIQTKVFVCSIGEFDTHAMQVEEEDSTIGIHATQLSRLSDALASFQQDLINLGLSDKVLTMTFSEFGRRIRSNDSYGTDHGTAAPLMLFGDCVQGGFLGDSPNIPENPSIIEGVPMQYDFRNVYGSILEDWLEIPEQQVKQILFDDYQKLPILANCVSSIEDNDLTNFGTVHAQLSPNPALHITRIQYYVPQSNRVRISVFNGIGSKLTDLINKSQPVGTHSIEYVLDQLPKGNYFIRVEIFKIGVKSLHLTKL